MNDKSAATQLKTAVNDFGRFIRACSEKDLVAKVWGPREVLAHLVFWLESFVSQTEALSAGKRTNLLKGSFNNLNAQAITANQDVTIIELLRRQQTACDNLCRIAERHDPDSLVLTLKRGSSFQRTLTQYLSAESDHIRHHLERLRYQAQRDSEHEAEMLRQAVVDFCTFIESLPGHALEEQAWGPKEVLAHLVFWQERYVAQVEATLAKRPFTGPQASLKKLNAQAVAASRGVPMATLIQRFQTATGRLSQYGQTLDPQNIVLARKLPYDRRTLDDVVLTAVGHIRDHQKKLQRSIRI